VILERAGGAFVVPARIDKGQVIDHDIQTLAEVASDTNVERMLGAFVGFWVVFYVLLVLARFAVRAVRTARSDRAGNNGWTWR